MLARRERALALNEWLNRGGFCPPGNSEAKVRATITDVLRRTTDSDDECADDVEGGGA